eukprot:TRINITY_DN2357_c5_g1_i1.p1 TRINITY_DN2357_c5_g1~~TRINITY_DN2357_c5_g1_i1.p1  ORF type:complete len:2450 (+),score=763.78 TRINITY_DN2357_c5_g1_i1:53-7351(+)
MAEPEEEPPQDEEEEVAPPPIDPFELPKRYRFFTVHLDTDTPANLRPADLFDGKGSFREQFGDSVRILDRETVREWFAAELPKELAELDPPVEPPALCKRMEQVPPTSDAPPDLMAAAFHCRVASLGREYLREESDRLEGRRKEADRRAKQRKEYIEMGLPTDELDAQDAAAAKEDDQVPQVIEFHSSPQWPALSGIYRLQSGTKMGRPRWRCEEGGGWLSDNGGGYWIVSESAAQYEDGFGQIRSSAPHGGSLPHQLSSWQHLTPSGGWHAAPEVELRAEDPKFFLFFQDYPRTMQELTALQTGRWLERPGYQTLRCHCCATIDSELPVRLPEAAEDGKAAKGKPAPKAAKPPSKKGRGQDADAELPKESLHKLLRAEMKQLGDKHLQSEIRDIVDIRFDMPRMWFGTQLVGQRENVIVEHAVSKLGPRFDALEVHRRNFEIWSKGKWGRELTLPALTGYEAPAAPKQRPSKVETPDPAPPAKKPAAKKGRAEEPEVPAEPEEPPPPPPPEPPTHPAAIRCHRSLYDELVGAIPDTQMSVAAVLQGIVEQVSWNDDCRRKILGQTSGGDAFGDDTPSSSGAPAPAVPVQNVEDLDAKVSAEQVRRKTADASGALSDYIDLIFGRLEGEEARVRDSKVDAKRHAWIRTPSAPVKHLDSATAIRTEFPLGATASLRGPDTVTLCRDSTDVPWGLATSETAEVTATEGPSAAVPIGAVVLSVGGELKDGADVAAAVSTADSVELKLEIQRPVGQELTGVVVGWSRGRVGLALADGTVRGVVPSSLVLHGSVRGDALAFDDAIGARSAGAKAVAALHGVPVEQVERRALELLGRSGGVLSRPGLFPDFEAPRAQRCGRQSPRRALPGVAWLTLDGVVCITLEDGTELKYPTVCETPEEEAETAAILAHTGPLEPGAEPVEVPPLPPPRDPAAKSLPALPPELDGVDPHDLLDAGLVDRELALLMLEDMAKDGGVEGADFGDRLLTERLDRDSFLQRLQCIASTPMPPTCKAAWLDSDARRGVLLVQHPVPATRVRWETGQARFTGRVYFPEWLKWRTTVDDAERPKPPPPSAKNLPPEEREDGEEQEELQEEPAEEVEEEEQPAKPEPEVVVVEAPEEPEPTLLDEVEGLRGQAGLKRLKGLLQPGADQQMLIDWAPGSVSRAFRDAMCVYSADGGQLLGVRSGGATECVHSVAWKDGVTAGVHKVVHAAAAAATAGMDDVLPSPPAASPVTAGATEDAGVASPPAPAPTATAPLVNPTYGTVSFPDGVLMCFSTQVEFNADGSDPSLHTVFQHGGADGFVVTQHGSTGDLDISVAPPLHGRTSEPVCAADEQQPAQGTEAVDGTVRIRRAAACGDGRGEVLCVYDGELGKEAEIVTREVSRRVTQGGTVVRHMVCGSAQVLLADANVATVYKGSWLVTRRDARVAVPAGGPAVTLPALPSATHRDPETRALVTWRSDMVVMVEYDKDSVIGDGTVMVQHADGTRIWQSTSDGKRTHRVAQQGMPAVTLLAGDVPRTTVHTQDGGTLAWKGGPEPEVEALRSDGDRVTADIASGVLRVDAAVQSDGGYFLDYVHGTVCVADQQGHCTVDAAGIATVEGGDPADTEPEAGGAAPLDLEQPAADAFTAVLPQARGAPLPRPARTLPQAYRPVTVRPIESATKAACVSASPESETKIVSSLRSPDARSGSGTSHPPALFLVDLKRAALDGGGIASQLLCVDELAVFARKLAKSGTSELLQTDLDGVTNLEFQAVHKHLDRSDLTVKTHCVPRAVRSQRHETRRPLQYATQPVPPEARLQELAADTAGAAAIGDGPPVCADAVVRSLQRHPPTDPDVRLLLRHHLKGLLAHGPRRECALQLKEAETLAAALVEAGVELDELTVSSVGGAAAAAGVKKGWCVTAVAGEQVAARADADAAFLSAGGACDAVVSAPQRPARVSAALAQQQQSGARTPADAQSPAAEDLASEQAQDAAQGTQRKPRRDLVKEMLQEARELESAPTSFWRSRSGAAALPATEADRMKYARKLRDLAPQPPPQSQKAGASPHGEMTASQQQEQQPEPQPENEEPLQQEEQAAAISEARLEALSHATAVFPKYAFTESRMILRRPESPCHIVTLVFTALHALLGHPPTNDWADIQSVLMDPRAIPRLQRVADGRETLVLSQPAINTLNRVAADQLFTEAQASQVLFHLGQLVQWITYLLEYLAHKAPAEPQEDAKPADSTTGLSGHRLDVYGQPRKGRLRVPALRSDLAHADPNIAHMAKEGSATRTVRYCGNTKEQTGRKQLKELGSSRVLLDPVQVAQGRIVVAPPQCNFGSVTEGKRYAMELTLTNVGQIAGRFMVRRLNSTVHDRINDIVSFYYKKGPIAPGMSIRVQVVLSVDTVMPDIDEVIEIRTEAQIVVVPLLASVRPFREEEEGRTPMRKAVKCLGRTRLQAISPS